MKQNITRFLLGAASWLLSAPLTQAQVNLAPAPSPTLFRPHALTLPAQASSRPQAFSASVKEVAKQRIFARTKGQSIPQFDAARAQARTRLTETATQLWASRFQGPLADAVVDAAGNLYLTGTSNADYLTVKYSPTGQQLWQRSYNWTGVTGASGDDRAAALKVDAAGNVYVTGTSNILDTPSRYTAEDFATIKYSPSGQLLWTARFNNVFMSRETASALTLDGAGNLCVAGTTVISGAGVTMLVVQYSPTGQIGWVNQGEVRDNERAEAATVDATGNVYVLGSNINTGGGALRKFSRMGGSRLWSATVADGGVPVRFTDLGADATGNLLVTGTTTASTGQDYRTFKYAGNTGQQLWQARYNGPGNGNDTPTSLGIDGAGNVYVTGVSGTDLATLKYESGSGQLVWEARAPGAVPSPIGPPNPPAPALVLDATNNVYVSGTVANASSREYLTLKYSPNGQTLWEVRFPGQSNSVSDQVHTVGLDGAGYVYVVGRSSSEVALVKYAQNSVQEGWATRFTGAGSSAEVARDVATDAAGNVYVTGYAYNGRNYDYLTLKYSPSGQQLWEARYNGPADGEDVPAHLVIDALGNVVVTGTSYGVAGSDYATLTYDGGSGQQLWVTHYNGPANSYDDAANVAVDAAGNVYVTGSSDNGPNGSYDYATIKYDARGQQQWVVRYNGPANGYDLAADLVVDAGGNVYVTGTTYSDTQSDYATVKYNPAGQQQWDAYYNGPANGYDEAAKLAFTTSENRLVVTGTSDGGTSTGFDIATVGYNSHIGVERWEHRYNGPASNYDMVADLAVENGVSVVITGTSYSATGADYATFVVAEGQLQWQATYNGPDNSYEEAKAVALDGAGNAYVTGLSYNADGTTDYATLKYGIRGAGQVLWTARYDGAGSYDEAAAITVGPTNHVYVTGYSLGTDTGYDFATLQYRQQTSGIPLATTSPVAAGEVHRAPLPITSAAKQPQELSVYPNPAAGPTTIRFRPTQSGAAQVCVYNQVGQQVASLYEGRVQQGQFYEFAVPSSQLSAGVYMCSLLLEGKRETIRLVVKP